jgi:hypothetical protein
MFNNLDAILFVPAIEPFLKWHSAAAFFQRLEITAEGIKRKLANPARLAAENGNQNCFGTRETTNPLVDEIIWNQSLLAFGSSWPSTSIESVAFMW